MIKKLILILIILTSACASNAPPNLSPTAQTAYTNTQRIQALDVLRDIAIDGNSKGIISISTTRRVVQAHEDIIKLIDASAANWQTKATIIANAILVNLPKAESDILTPLVNSVLVSLR